MYTKYFKKWMFLIVAIFFALQFACNNKPKETGDPLSKPAPSAPAGVIATAGDGQIVISWNVVTAATSYNIYWSTTSGVTKSNGTKITNITNQYTHTGITNGTTYYYVIAAVNSYGESSESGIVNATPSALNISPSVPTGIIATAGDGEVIINWNAATGATSYNIYWSTTSGITKTNGIKISNVTSIYTHIGRTNGTTYYYIITAVNSYGESIESNAASATPSAIGIPLSTPDRSIISCRRWADYNKLECSNRSNVL